MMTCGGATTTYMRIVKAFETKYNCKVKITDLNYATRITQMAAAVAAGNAFDICGMQGADFPVEPIKGLVEPLENEEESKLPKTSKNILYFVAILSSLGIFILLNHLTHTQSGLHSIGTATLANLNYFYVILLMAIGIVLSYVYFISHRMVKGIFKNLENNFIIKGVIGGLLLGIIGTLLPLTMFSGEEQIYLLLGAGAELGLIVLILTSIIKIVLTNLCIETGLKGGHFFPMIFSGTAMGYAMSILLNMDPIIAMAIVTSSFMASILKKPLAVVLLLMIIFPMNLIPLMLVSAVIACLFETPEILQIAQESL